MTLADPHAVFRARLDASPTVVASAPGRVNLVGGHTDYNDGFVLPAAIDHRTVVAARARDDRTVRVHATAFDETATFSVDDCSPGGDWTDYVAGVVTELAALTDESLPGVDLLILDGVPQGAGLSSSAALEVAVGGAVAGVAGLDVTDEAIALAAWRAETSFVGLSCGIMDQYASALGRTDHALALDCRSRAIEAVPLGTESRVVVVDTNVEHALAGSAYNDRVAECAQAVTRLADALDRSLDSLRDVDVDDVLAHEGDLPDPVFDRAIHVVRENDRVQEAVTALRAGDLERVGDLMNASHESLRDHYEVSCAELDFVVDRLGTVEGVYGARMTGGGFGGSVVALARPDAVSDLDAAIGSDYREAFGVEADVYVCAVDDGLRVDTSAA
jgi:galactokinase